MNGLGGDVDHLTQMKTIDSRKRPFSGRAVGDKRNRRGSGKENGIETNGCADITKGDG